MNNKTSEVLISKSVISLVAILLALLVFFVIFISRNLEKSQIKLEEQLANVPEPSIPSGSHPITLSAGHIRTKQGTTETIKFAVFNPSQEDWIFRDALHGGGCGVDGDLICFIDPSDTTSTCDTYGHADDSDTDCGISDKNPFDRDGVCVIHTVQNAGGGADPDCAPQEGIQLSLACDDKLTGKTFQYNTKVIKAREYDNFYALIKIKRDAQTGLYLCQINVLSGADKYTKDVIFEI